MDLKNKVAVVTGGSGGIGSAVAQRLAEAEKIAASLPGLVRCRGLPA